MPPPPLVTAAASEPPAPGFDWESLIGVKLFSAIAGIALVVAAVLFLRYSIEAGWLQPPVRVAIGILVAIALLVVCEMKAARRYPVTANAMDAAAIAILFATFFAAHALWNLIPALVAFGLLALVTLIAVLLSIRRESLFIAVLGLLGGFATPALLSTGENRPDPALCVSAVAEHRARAGRLHETLADTDRADAHPDGDLSVGLGPQVPGRQQRVAGDGDLPAVSPGGVSPG